MKLWKKAVPVVAAAAIAAMCHAPAAQAQEYQDETVFKKLSLLDERPVEGRWNIEGKDITSGGRVFSGSAGMDVPYGYAGNDGINTGFAVFSNKDDYDLFECQVGYKGSVGEGRVNFEVRGDGKTLYTSPWIVARDKPVQVRVSIEGYSGITLIARGDKVRNQSDAAVWIHPAFVKVNREAPPTNDTTSTDWQGSYFGFKITDSKGSNTGRERPGALILSVIPNSPASQSGLQFRDIIVAYNRIPVLSSRQLSGLISYTPSGTRVEITYFRNGTRASTDVVTEDEHDNG
jgi:hypothetical protein